MNFAQSVDRIFIRRLVAEAMTSGQKPGKMEVVRLDLDMARAFTEAVFEANRRSLDEQIPEFDQNFLLAKHKTQMGRTRRKDMPVINDNQVREFQKRLKKGSLDIEKPLAPVTDPSNPWPEGLSGPEAQEFVKRGLEDKNLSDDKVQVSLVKVPAKDLNPIQRQIYLDKAMGATAKSGIPATKAFLQKSLMILSQDQFIIDGHHRWLSSLIVEPAMKLSGIKIAIPIAKLLPLSVAYGDALGNKRNL